MTMAKYSKGTWDESNAIRKLADKLENSKHIKTFFKEDDKTPDIDGSFILIDKDSTAKKRFVVQIKKIEKIKENKKKKVYYDFNTAFFEYIKKRVDETPAIYFIVDITANTIYWLYLSDKLLMKLNFEGKKTVRIPLTNDNILADIDKFFERMNEIIEERNKKFINKTPEQIAEIQEAVGWFNTKFDSLLFIKKELFPKLWRFGIAHSQESDKKSNLFAIYPQIKGIPDYGIREISENELYFQKTWDSTTMITPQKYVKNVFAEYLKQYFTDKSLDPKYLPDIVLHEIAFAFLDKIAKHHKTYCIKGKVNTYYRDEENLQTFEDLLNNSFSFMRYILTTNNCTKKEKDVQKILRNSIPFRGIDILDDMRIDIFAKKYSTGMLDNTILFNTLKSDYKLFNNSCIELKKRNIVKLKRVWDFNSEIDEYMPSNYSLYNKIKFEAAIEEWLTKVPQLYEEFLANTKIVNDFKYTANVKYNVIQSSHRLIPFNYTMYSKQYKNNGKLTITHDPTIKSDKAYNQKEKGLLSRSEKIFHDEFFFDKKPYYEAIRAFTYQGIAKALDIKCDGILLKHRRVTLFDKT
jgi:hypothetical protein